ncbi:aminotransferase class V-fold PLP-dependent enzyme, partial [Staphylococcus pseudintermedius]|uniref:aminotransferase class V-fold PLP-dependent enzyme n=1 Tax=Staphylococcus pseudintermedius TaxID=283734 RepID=UPI000E26C7B5
FVDLYYSTWTDLLTKFEAVTPLIAQAIGLQATIEYIESIGFDAIHEHEQAVTTYAYEQMSQIEGIDIYEPSKAKRAVIITINRKDVHPHDVATSLVNECG